MQALIATVHDPISRRRSVRTIARPRRVRALAPRTERPFIAVLNGKPLLRAAWGRKVRDGDTLAFVALPAGGGGGSDPLRVVLMLAVVVAAPYLGPALAGFAGFGSAAVWTGVATVAGTMLVNALVPPPKPPSTAALASAAAASPTYSLQAQGNLARLDAAIPVQYGRMAAFPDFAAQPYTEFAGNEQYLYQLLCLGQGSYEVEEIRIEDTPIASFAEITTEVVQPGATLTLFPANVVTSTEVSGQELSGSYTGPFVASAASSGANAIGIDMACPRGLYYANNSGGLDSMSVQFQVEARAAGSSDPWVVYGTETFSAATSTPQRFSYRYSVPPGRYEVRVKRLDTKQTDSRYGHDLSWIGLRAYLPETRNFGDVTLIALRMRATNNLSAQASRKINVIATRKLFIWNPATGWSVQPQATRSIAWALADALSGTAYGARLPDSRIDLQALYDLDAIWSSRGDYFDGRFDNAITLWEALHKIAQVGRCKPYMQGGIVRFVRDAAQSVPVALFSPRNIVRGSFSLEFVMASEDTADCVEVSYFDADVWAPRRVTAALAGSASATPAKVDLLLGCTNRDQAYREGLYHAAANKYRRTMIRFATELEGFIPSFGDLVAIAHDMPAWGQTAEAVGWNAGTKTLTLDQPLTFATGTHYIGLRARDGSLEGPIVVTAGANAYQVVLSTSPTLTPYTAGGEERTHVVFGAGETWRQLARVVEVKPRGANQVEITCVNEDASVHTADNGVTAPAVNSSQLPTLYTAPVVAGLTARSMPGSPEIMLLSWQPAAGAEYYIVEISSDAQAWTRLGEPRTSNYTATAVYGPATIVRVAAVGLTRGPFVQIAYGESADYMWNATDTTLMWNATTTTLMWSY